MTRPEKEETLAEFSTHWATSKFFLSFLKKVLNLTIGKGDLTEEGNASRSLGTVYFSHGNFQKSIEYHEKHLKIANEIRGHQKDELMQISLMITSHWVTSKKPLSIMKNI